MTSLVFGGIFFGPFCPNFACHVAFSHASATIARTYDTRAGHAGTGSARLGRKISFQFISLYFGLFLHPSIDIHLQENYTTVLKLDRHSYPDPDPFRKTDTGISTLLSSSAAS